VCEWTFNSNQFSFHGLNTATHIKSLNVSETADYTIFKKEINNEPQQDLKKIEEYQNKTKLYSQNCLKILKDLALQCAKRFDTWS
jgi:hypothetical protein